MFKELLQELSRQVDGSLGIIIFGIDGLAIAHLSLSAEFNFEEIGAELVSLLKSTMHCTSRSDLGNLEELTVATARARLIVRAITEEYFVLFVLSPNSNFGKARYELRKAQVTLEGSFFA